MFYFVILNRNGKRFLEYCLPTVLNQSYEKIKIIIVDTNSKDGSIELVEKMNHSKIDLIVLPTEPGYAFKNNLGIKKALSDPDCEYICLLNNDTKINRDFCKEVIKAGKKFKDAGIISPKYYYMGTNKIQVAGGGNFSDKSPAGEIQLGAKEEDLGQWDKVQFIDYAYGAGWVVRPEVVRKTGYLDPHWGFGFEEPDFCNRAKRFGFRTIYLPTATVEHEVGGTSKNKPTLDVMVKIRLTYARNYFRFLIKHYSLSFAFKMELKRVWNAILHIYKPYMLFFEFYSVVWNIVFLFQTLGLKKMKKEIYD